MIHLRKQLAAFFILALAFLTVAAPAARADYFAAIAYSPSTGRYGYSYNSPTANQAKATAIVKANAGDARVVIWVKNGWCALARTRGGYGWGAAWGASKAAASNTAMGYCPKNQGGRYIACTVFSGSR